MASCSSVNWIFYRSVYSSYICFTKDPVFLVHPIFSLIALIVPYITFRYLFSTSHKLNSSPFLSTLAINKQNIRLSLRGSEKAPGALFFLLHCFPLRPHNRNLEGNFQTLRILLFHFYLFKSEYLPTLPLRTFCRTRSRTWLLAHCRGSIHFRVLKREINISSLLFRPKLSSPLSDYRRN